MVFREMESGSQRTVLISSTIAHAMLSISTCQRNLLDPPAENKVSKYVFKILNICVDLYLTMTEH